MKELLLLLCRYPFDETNREDLSRLLGAVRDWHEMVDLINAHGIIALAAYNIREAELEKTIPEDAMTLLDNGRMQSMVRNAWLTERWKEVNTILNNAGIKHILLKGMALEHTIYGAKGLRQMNDNDILVKREDAFNAWYLLQQEGFLPGLIKSPLYKKILADIDKHLPTLCKDGYAVEIHHKLYKKNKDEKSDKDSFNTAVEINIGSTNALILSREIQLIHLIDHYWRHAREGNCQLRLYTDIKLLEKNATISIDNHFILNPIQGNKPKYRKTAYRGIISSIPKKYRFRYIIGDIFPSVKWMKKRYRCNAFKALLYYPFRIGKLLWII